MKKIVALVLLFILNTISISSSFGDRFTVPVLEFMKEEYEDTFNDLIFETFGTNSEVLDIFIKSDSFNNNDELMVIYNHITTGYSPEYISKVNDLILLQRQLEERKDIISANKILFLILIKDVKVPPLFANLLIDKAKEERLWLNYHYPYLKTSKLINKCCKSLIQCE